MVGWLYSIYDSENYFLLRLLHVMSLVSLKFSFFAFIRYPLLLSQYHNLSSQIPFFAIRTCEHNKYWAIYCSPCVGDIRAPCRPQAAVFRSPPISAAPSVCLLSVQFWWKYYYYIINILDYWIYFWFLYDRTIKPSSSSWRRRGCCLLFIILCCCVWLTE